MNITLIKEFYSAIPFSTNDFDILLHAHKKVVVSKNQIIQTGGSVAKAAYIVQSGNFRSYIVGSKGNEITINFYQYGDLLGDLGSFLQSLPSNENIVSINGGVILEISFPSFLNLYTTLDSYREWARLYAAQEFIKLKKSSVDFRILEAKERYITLLKEKPEAVKHALLRDVASYLGITDTSLSRIRRELEIM